MRMIDGIAAELEIEGASTLRVLERVPMDQAGWRPHEKSMTLGQLAWHIALIPSRIVELVDRGSFILENARPAPDVREGSPSEAFGAKLEEIVTFLRQTPDEWAQEPFTFLRGEEVVRSIPRIAAIRSIMMNHSYHHRGQLTVYLRMLDVPLPAVYGTSADEQGRM